MSGYTDDERTTTKYQAAMDLTVELEQTTRHPHTRAELSEWEPQELYRYLILEWWREWNGLTQQWEPSY